MKRWKIDSYTTKAGVEKPPSIMISGWSAVAEGHEEAYVVLGETLRRDLGREF